MRSLLADDEKIVRRIECGSVAERQTLEAARRSAAITGVGMEGGKARGAG
ncbi:MAG: hypothetical protein R3B96_06305 [Pirellulaceae bacterium]